MAKPHRPAGTEVAYEAWIPEPRRSYSQRTIVGTWWNKPSAEQLKIAAGPNYGRVKLSEISVIKSGQRWYRVYRTPLTIHKDLPNVRTQPDCGQVPLQGSDEG